MDAPQLLDGMPQANMDDLQDDVLPIIVSFLPAHEAVRTSVLARRWRHAWTSAPALRITAVRGFGSAKFNHFVDRLLLLRRESPSPLESCEFNMVEGEFDFDWALSVQRVYLHTIQFALDCNVQFLRCCFLPNDSTSTGFAEDLPEPAAPLVSHHIKRLELYGIRSSLDFSGCPALIDLRMEYCVTLADNMVSDSLERLTMSCCELYAQHRTSIALPNLIHLELIDCFGRLPVFESLPSLERVIFRLGEFSGDRCSRSDSGCLNDNPCWDCRFAFEFDADRGRSYFFKGLSRAKHMDLSACYNHAFILQRDLKWRPTFHKLKTLILDDWCLDADLSALTVFIQHSPNLERLTLELFEEFDSFMVIEKSDHPLAGESASDHLKMVEIKCAKIDARVNKVLEILSTCGIPLDKIDIRQTDTGFESGCSDVVCTDLRLA